MTNETRLLRRIRRDFPAAGSAEEIHRQLAELRHDSDDMLGSERVQAAIVLLAAGDLARFRQAVTLSRTDWRDVLIAAGLANTDWATQLDQVLGPADSSSATEAPESPH
ncbi:hypothetical protein M8C13_08925 [Crossiella sp. SN42]|uniref:hypothetical protein n=1 Tax=Crossiella sp. SN42 TaxID=2944808 RepID=UPI00207D3129|nr:hypothetical protein [Crossiella sp. SN42]MCO1575879.1 hypothetical protein [Crossiella sp. SN42]